MTVHHVYAPGVHLPGDEGLTAPIPAGGAYDPARGPGGVFARTLQGSTPKYAINKGPREIAYQNTLARMYMRVPRNEREIFMGSVSDSVLKRSVLPQLVGSLSSEVSDTGYVDFFIQQVSSGLQEKMNVSESLSDNYVAYFFGQSPPQWTYQGTLINTVQDDQLSAWVRLYLSVLRGTQEARRGKIVMLRYDNFIVEGTIFNTSWQHNAANEIAIPFNFSLLVKRIRIVNSTLGWQPTKPNSPWEADPLANPNTTGNVPSRTSTSTPTTVVQPAEVPAPPESTAAAGARTTQLTERHTLRSGDVQSGNGMGIPSGTQITVLEPGERTRTNPGGVISRSYRVQAGEHTGYMFLREDELASAPAAHDSSQPAPVDRAAATAGGNSPDAPDMVPPVNDVRPQDQGVVAAQNASNGSRDAVGYSQNTAASGETPSRNYSPDSVPTPSPTPATAADTTENGTATPPPRSPTPAMGNGSPAPAHLATVCR